MAEKTMGKGRIEAFSDGVIAIIITIMVLELKEPHGVEWSALKEILPVFLSYTLSFVYLGIYWNNHHHLFQAVHKVNGAVLWANLHLLFWLSLVPFTTGWISENHIAPLPVALYGVVLLGAAIAYFILVRVLLAHHGKDSLLAQAIGSDIKGKISVVLYILAVVLAFPFPIISCGIHVVIAILWLVPDRRIEKVLS